MKLQIVEPMSGGHHSNYVAALLPSTRALTKSGLLSHVTVTVTRPHKELLDTLQLLPEDTPRFRTDARLASVSASPTLAERKTLFDSVRACGTRASPG